MTLPTKVLFAAAFAGFAAFAATAPAQALTMQECSAKYKQAKDSGALNGQKWNDFRKAQCAADATATPAAAPAAPAAEAKPAKEPAKEAEKEAAPAAAPVAVGNAAFPATVDAKYASEKPHMARMHTCADQWKVNKDAKTTGGMRWNQKGGGYYSECNKRLKGGA
jgi:hypothetical protein